MLSRIWGRTHMRSTARDITTLHYSPFGDIHTIAPTPDIGKRVWLLDSRNAEDLDILLGFAVLNDLNVRVHAPSDVRPSMIGVGMTDSTQRKGDLRKERLLKIGDLTQKLSQCDTAMTSWQSALQTLQDIPFGSMNSLEVLQIILQELPKSNLQWFRRVDATSFEWSEAEFRMIESHLNSLQQGSLSTPLEWPNGQLVLNSLVFHDLDEKTGYTHINQVRHDLDEIRVAVQQLGRLLAHDYRSQVDRPDWSTVQSAVGRSTLLTLPVDEQIQMQGKHIESLVQAFTHSLLALGWFRDWSGFQFISFEEMELEIIQLQRRLIQLKTHLPEIIQSSSDQHAHQQLPLPIQAVLQVIPEQQLESFRTSFPCWYLSRWIEYKTPMEAWRILTDDAALAQSFQELQDQAWGLMELNLYQVSWQDRIQFTPDQHPSSDETHDASSWVDLYWQVSPPADLSFQHLKNEPAILSGPELTRLIYLMKQLPPESHKDLPAPLHTTQSFWDPSTTPDSADRIRLTSSPVELAL